VLPHKHLIINES